MGDRDEDKDGDFRMKPGLTDLAKITPLALSSSSLVTPDQQPLHLSSGD
jgi:hypothetical protein